jgi:hypothetical protein
MRERASDRCVDGERLAAVGEAIGRHVDDPDDGRSGEALLERHHNEPS